MTFPFAGRAVVTALVLAAALATASVADAAVLHRGNGSEPQTLDPAHAATASETAILQDLYEGLTVYDAAGEVVPGVAESWTVSDDRLVYTFHLREAAKWSNGDPVTAEDFVFALRRIADPKTAARYADLLYPIRNAVAINALGEPADTLGVRAINARTLEITLERPTARFPALLAHPAALPMHRATVAAAGADFGKAGTATVSNGAFMLSGEAADDRLTLVRNPAYWDTGNVRLDAVEYYPTDDEIAAIRRFAAGELDLNYGFPPDQAAALSERFGRDAVRMTPTLSVEYYAFDTRRPPFDDARVRRALSLAIDRDALARMSSAPMLPLASLIPPDIPGYTAADSDTAAGHGEAARQLLSEAGYGEGGRQLKVEIRYNDSGDHGRIAAGVASMWTALGAEVKLTAAATEAHYAALQKGDPFSVARVGWTAACPDPESLLSLAASTTTLPNYSHYADAEFDERLAKAAGETDAAANAEDLREAEAILLRDQPMAPLLVAAAPWLVSAKVKGWQDNAANAHLSRFLAVE